MDSIGPGGLTSSSRGMSQTLYPELSANVTREGNYCMIYGDFSDIWKSKWSLDGESRTVAIKSIRGVSSIPQEQQTVSQKLSNIYRTWHRVGELHHPNISPFYGVVNNCGPLPSPVVPLYEDGNILTYLKKNPNIDRLKLVYEIASALQCIHSFTPPVVHGNMKASNILIAQDGRACLADIGISVIASTSNFTTPNIAGSCRWMAPEIMDPPEYNDSEDEPIMPLTPASDVYAWAMTVLEIYTEKPPFNNIRLDSAVIAYVMRGNCPPRPRDTPSITENIWDLLLECWNRLPSKRPTMSAVTTRLFSMYSQYELGSVLTALWRSVYAKLF